MENVTEELVRQNGNQAAAVMADYAGQGGGSTGGETILSGLKAIKLILPDIGLPESQVDKIYQCFVGEEAFYVRGRGLVSGQIMFYAGSDFFSAAQGAVCLQLLQSEDGEATVLWLQDAQRSAPRFFGDDGFEHEAYQFLWTDNPPTPEPDAS